MRYLNFKVCLNNRMFTTFLLQAFFASDGRSKKQQPQVEDVKPKYTCTECGKNYATSSNLSRHRQTHRTLDSTNAKKCPICNKVVMPFVVITDLFPPVSDVCQYARLVNAHSDSQPQPQVRCLWQSLLPALAASGSHEVSHRRQTLWLCSLWQILC